METISYEDLQKATRNSVDYMAFVTIIKYVGNCCHISQTGCNQLPLVLNSFSSLKLETKKGIREKKAIKAAQELGFTVIPCTENAKDSNWKCLYLLTR